MHRRNPRCRLLLVALTAGALLGVSAVSAGADGPPAGSAEDWARAHRIVEAYKERFQNVEAGLGANLGALYTEDVQFEDPVTRADGLDALRAYLDHFAEQSGGARFEMEGELVAPGEAAIFWRMVFPGKDDEPGRSFPGVSRIFFRDRIHAERDYFDLGEAVYERVPVVGWMVRRVKGRLK